MSDAPFNTEVSVHLDLAKSVLREAREQQRKWDDANTAAANEGMVDAKAKLRNTVAPHLAAQAQRVEGTRRLLELCKEECKQGKEIEYRLSANGQVVWAFVPWLGPDSLGVSVSLPSFPSSLCFEKYKHFEVVARPANAASETDLLDAIYLQNRLPPPSLVDALEVANDKMRDARVERDWAQHERDQAMQAATDAKAIIEQLVYPNVLSADELYLLAGNRNDSEQKQVRVHEAVQKLRAAQMNAKAFLASFALPKATSDSPLVAALKAIVDADAAYCDAHGEEAEIAASNNKQNAIDAARRLIAGMQGGAK